MGKVEELNERLNEIVGQYSTRCDRDAQVIQELVGLVRAEQQSARDAADMYGVLARFVSSQDGFAAKIRSENGALVKECARLRAIKEAYKIKYLEMESQILPLFVQK